MTDDIVVNIFPNIKNNGIISTWVKFSDTEAKVE